MNIENMIKVDSTNWAEDYHNLKSEIMEALNENVRPLFHVREYTWWLDSDNEEFLEKDLEYSLKIILEFLENIGADNIDEELLKSQDFSELKNFISDNLYDYLGTDFQKLEFYYRYNDKYNKKYSEDIKQLKDRIEKKLSLVVDMLEKVRWI